MLIDVYIEENCSLDAAVELVSRSWVIHEAWLDKEYYSKGSQVIQVLKETPLVSFSKVDFEKPREYYTSAFGFPQGEFLISTAATYIY